MIPGITFTTLEDDGKHYDWIYRRQCAVAVATRFTIRESIHGPDFRHRSRTLPEPLHLTYTPRATAAWSAAHPIRHAIPSIDGTVGSLRLWVWRWTRYGDDFSWWSLRSCAA